MPTLDSPSNYFGRDTEWSYISQRITSTDGSRHIVYISGRGGVGKTALLDLIFEVYALDQNSAYTVLNAIDFDDLTLRLPINFMERVARRLSSQDTESLFQQFWTLYSEDVNENLARRGKHQEEMTNAFVTGLQRLGQRKRVVLLVDTLEKAPMWFPVFFARVVSAVPNVVIVLVGRPESQPIERSLEEALSSPEDVPDFQSKSFQWSGLDPSLCEEYFSEREEFRQLAQDLKLLGMDEISPELKRRIWTLARGIPFQVNLVAGALRFLESGDQQLNRQISELLQQIQQADADALERDPNLRQQFQQALVAPFVLNFNRPELPGAKVDYARLTSRIILLIAHINHYMAHALGGFDASVLAELDDTLDENKVQQALDYIEENRSTQFTFVKVFRGPDGQISGIGLHDEMVRMLTDLAWIRLDPPGRLDPYRRKISAKLINYYDRKCLELYADAEDKQQDQLPQKTWEKIWARAVGYPKGQALLLSRVFHSVYEDFEKGWHWAYDLSEHIFMHTDFDALLYDSVEAYIKATPRAQDPVIKAKMNVWKAGAHIARNELPEARDLLQGSIAIWTDEYRHDEEEIRRLEQNRAVLEKSRLALLREQREQPERFAEVQNMVNFCDTQLGSIQQEIQSKTKFRDMERAYTSMGFTYRLEGRWQQAIDHYHNALKYSRWLGDRESIAELANNMANVYLLWGRLSDAALYGQIGASIRRHLDVKKELGHSYRILGRINWRIGNTYGSRMYLNQARKCYQEDPVALAWLDLYEGYTYYRIGDTTIGHKSLEEIPGLGDRVPPIRSYELLEQARKVFEQYERRDDVAWAHNMLSRAYRRDGEFEDAEDAAKQALKLAQSRLRLAEAHLSLCMLYYRWGLQHLRAGDKEDALGKFEEADGHYERGHELAEEGQFVALLSVYEGVKGNIEYERGADDPDHYEIAFSHYLRECQIAARNKAMRFERALNEVVADRLARMPFDLAMKYADALTDAEKWKATGLDREYKKLKDEVDELKLFLGLPERAQIDEMEDRFNRYMRLGDYHEALEEARSALQQFYRYNWSSDTIRVLLKTAQAYRKVTRYTAARRYCKQALLIIEGLIKQDGQNGQNGNNLTLIRQKAHADFTMGRILWEIGNTAEAATHFMLAREAYLEYRTHPDQAFASEMRQGLARAAQYEGMTRLRIGELNEALVFVEWAEQEFRDMENYRRVAKALNLKARIHRDRDAQGDIEKAQEALDEALRLVGEIGDKYTTAECYLTYMILAYQESQKQGQVEERLRYLRETEGWYRKGAEIAHDNNYTLLQSVYEGVLGNVFFDRARLEARTGEKTKLEPAFDQYLEECRWGAHVDKRRFFRSLDLLMRRLSLLSSDEIRYYVEYMRQEWTRYAQEGKLPGQGSASTLTSEYIRDMQHFCDLVEDFSEYIAS